MSWNSALITNCGEPRRQRPVVVTTQRGQRCLVLNA
ncbi:unnamed protein product [Brassica rapa subsp. narinosa]